jgi:hypothetical protein
MDKRMTSERLTEASEEQSLLACHRDNENKATFCH